MNKEDIAYIAGIVDGEGSLGVYKYKNSRTGYVQYRAALQIGNTNEELISWLSHKLHINNYLKAYNSHPNGKPIYSVHLTGKKTIALIPLILPHLIVKRRVSLLILDFYRKSLAIPGKRDLPQVEKDRRDQLVQETKRLNHQGFI